MLTLIATRSFACVARVLVLALGLAFAFESLPAEAAPTQLCAVAGDCMLAPAEEPREREETVFIVGAAVESQQNEADEAMPAAALPALAFVVQTLPPTGQDKEPLRISGHDILPDKTGPPRV